MITLSTKATVTENSMMTLSLPANLPKGEYNIVIVIEDNVHDQAPLWSLNIKGEINPEETFRREDTLY